MTREFAEEDVLCLWEKGIGQPPPARALMVLAAAFPESPRAALGALTIGQRDARLLAVRERIFGPVIVATATCPECHGRVEFSLRTEDICLPEPPDLHQPQVLSSGEYEIAFRLPDGLDVRAIPAGCDLADARSMILRRCVLKCHYAGRPLLIDLLPEEVVDALSARMAALDPQAELYLALGCEDCGHKWRVLFDILAFLWAEISAKVRRLLREVHELARAYGWREQDILAMSPARRALYREMAT